MRGNVQGVALKIDVDTLRRPPGPSEASQSMVVVAAAAPLSDQIVCRISDVDQVMGPLPGVAGTPTGDRAFDRTYTVFVSPGPGDVRDATPVSPLCWATPTTLTDMITHRLVFLLDFVLAFLAVVLKALWQSAR